MIGLHVCILIIVKRNNFILSLNLFDQEIRKTKYQTFIKTNAKFNLTLWNQTIKAGATDADADSDKVEDCDTDATAKRYVFEQIRSAKKPLKKRATSKRRLISNKLGSDQTYSTANYDDHFSSYSYDNSNDDIDTENDIDTEEQIKAIETATQLNIHFLWIFLRDLLASIVNTNDNRNNNDTNENTDNTFELNGDCDYLDDNDLCTVYDGDDSNADEHSQKHKLLRQKLLGNFYGIL